MPFVEDISRRLLARELWSDDLRDALAPLGFEDPEKAWGLLLDLAGQVNFPVLYPAFFPALVRQLGESYDPDMGLANFERFTVGIYDKNYLYTLLNGDPRLLQALATLFSGSQVLTDTLLSNPAHFDWLKHPDTLYKTKPRDVLYRDYYAMAGDRYLTDDTPALLRRFKRREYVRIGLRDLLGLATMSATVEDLSNLADVCLQAAYEYADKTLKKKHGVPMHPDADGNMRETEFAILAMGKLGGQELNFSSDIDLIYIYTTSRGETQSAMGDTSCIAVTNHEYFTKLAQVITKTLHDITGEGCVFRVDLDLRPEGKSGEIANSLASCETYYQSWGRTWERQALIKARVCAGSETLGDELFSILEPFIYRKHLDFAAVEEIREMKRKIDQSLRQKGMDKGHIKLGFGGIREIEFMVQAYQLLFGGRDKGLRLRTTLTALDRLLQSGFITADDHHTFRDAYIFLRNLENRVQISFGLQTYHLPKDEKNLAVLARKMGIAGTSATQRTEALQSEFARHTQFVGNYFQGLFEEKKKESVREIADREAPATPGPADFIPDLLRGARFTDPERTYRFLVSLRDGGEFSHPTEKSLRDFYRILPRLLSLCAHVARPDSAVENLVKFLDAGRVRESFLALFNQNEKFLELLLTLFGGGDYLAQILIRRPDLMDILLNVDAVYRFKPQEKMAEDLRKQLQTAPRLEDKKILLCRFKQGEELRIGMRYLIRESDLPGTLADLSSLADVFLQIVCELALAETARESSVPTPGEFAVIGMGKLGGSELNFGSDLDVLFVYDAASAPDEWIPHYTAVAQNIFRLASEMTEAGYAYKIDTDLRPEGSKGVIVLSFGGYADYFKSRAQVWERQALTRARCVAGDAETGRRFIELAHGFIYQRKLEYGELIEIARLRERMEIELAQEQKKGKNIKLGRGGLADIEFAVQILQLLHGHKHPRLRQTNTLRSLQALADSGILDEATVKRLREHYLFLRNLECVLRITPAANHLPQEAAELARLARLLGYPVTEDDSVLAGRLSDAYRDVTESIRAFYQKTVGSLLRTAL
jgi:glutamate-ammonia-ligase adenylyltransferase